MKRLAYIFYALLMALVPSLSAALPAVAAKPPPPNPWPVVWSNQTRLDATSIPKFVDQLSVLDATGKSNGTMQTVDATTPSETIEMREFKANILPHTTVLPGNIPYSGTWAWGYLARGTAATSNRDTYIGPVIVAKRGTPSSVTFVNNLPSTATVKAPAYNFSTDQSIHWANPNMVDKYVLNPFPPYFPTWIGNPNHYAGAYLQRYTCMVQRTRQPLMADQSLGSPATAAPSARTSIPWAGMAAPLRIMPPTGF